jgi:hypothetical protein
MRHQFEARKLAKENAIELRVTASAQAASRKSGIGA